jgi:purine-cytosine permease-like protein
MPLTSIAYRLVSSSSGRRQQRLRASLGMNSRLLKSRLYNIICFRRVSSSPMERARSSDVCRAPSLSALFQRASSSELSSWPPFSAFHRAYSSRSACALPTFSFYSIRTPRGFGKVPSPSFQLLAVLGTQVPICVPFLKTVALAAAVEEASSRVVARGTIRIIYIGHGV